VHEWTVVPPAAAVTQPLYFSPAVLGCCPYCDQQNTVSTCGVMPSVSGTTGAGTFQLF